MRHVLVAPQEFKRVLTAHQVASALAAGLALGKPAWALDVVPLADGGPGTMDAILSAQSGEVRTATVEDPLGRPIQARWALLADGTAIVEMAEASGLWRLGREERDAAAASTYGAGQLIRAALEEGAHAVFVAAGGSATNDGGAGALQALGAQLIDGRGREVPRGGAALATVAHLDLSRLDARCGEVPIRVLTDVRNVLLGPQGATAVFAGQKGADAQTLATLEAALAHFAQLVTNESGRDLRSAEGSGAAGGFAFGLAALLGAQLGSGFDALAQLLQLDARVQAAGLVITGEGRLDAQTGFGKGPARLAQLARAHGTRVVCFCGVAHAGAMGAFDDVVQIAPAAPPATADHAMRLLTSAAQRWARTQPD